MAIKFSVVVCAYNEEKYLGDCLKSLIEMNYPENDYEIIIVDNQSTDRSPAIIEQYLEDKSVKVSIKAYRIEHVGLAISRNFAISKSISDVIVFIDGDAIADKELLNAYSKTFSVKNVDYSSGKISLLNKKSTLANLLQNTKYRQKFSGNTRNTFHGANMAFRKHVVDETKFIENFYSRGDDSSISIILRSKYVYHPTEDAIVYHERPENFRELISITREELSLSYRVANLAAKKGKIFVSSFYKNLFACTSQLFFLIFSLIYPISWPIFFILFYRFNRFEVCIDKGPLDFLFSLFLCLIKICFTSLGNFVSFLKYRKESPSFGKQVYVNNSKTNYL